MRALKQSRLHVDASHGPMRHRARGQAVIEFGLIVMLFFLLLFGLFDMGMLFNDWISITSAASVGARQAAVGACLGPTCSNPDEKSVIQAIMTSPPVWSGSDNCLPGHLQCSLGVDLAIVDLNIPAAYCVHIERNTDGTLSGPYSPLRMSSAAGVACGSTEPMLELNDTIAVAVGAEATLPVSVCSDWPIGATGPGSCLPTKQYLQSSSTVRYEGDFIP